MTGIELEAGTSGPDRGLGLAAAGLQPRYRLLVAGCVMLALALAASGTLEIGRGYGPLPGVPGLPTSAGTHTSATPHYVRALEGIARPLGVAVGGDGRIYVTEGSGSRRVRVFDAHLRELAPLAASGTDAQAWAPAYVAVSPGGDVYVSDIGNHTVHVFGPDGAYSRDLAPPAAPGADWSPLGVAFSPDGQLFVTDVTPGQHRVIVFDQQGRFRFAFGREGAGDGEFSFPNDVAVDRRGFIFVSDSNNRRIQVFDAVGGAAFKIGGPGTGALSAPRGLAIDGLGRLHVVDTVLGTVEVYDVTGAPTLLYRMGGASGSEDSFSYPNGIALDASGRVYVTDRENNRVQVWESN